jgi:hypothetical protein
MKKYKVIRPFKSHCCCLKMFNIEEVWTLFKMISKKRAYIEMADGGLHKVKLSRAITNSMEL